ncbi:glycosyltransferase [Xenorhabdus bharatensis]|uniref:glycosyltransferase n=1 Tax=Xenorhabdus bharatensis TaxID=3136256 RepID=UPI0030F49BCF
MNIPNKVHYFWTGNNISKENLMNIISMRGKNPDFEFHLWVSDKSLIVKTFSSMLTESGEIFGCEFDKFGEFGGFEKSGESNESDESDEFGEFVEFKSEDLKYKNKFIKKSNRFFIRNINEAFISLGKSFFNLESMYYRNINGFYNNYALASDIARLVILYTEGGVYLDVDVKFKKSNKVNFFKEINVASGISFGDVTGSGWISKSFGNAIIAAPIRSSNILDILKIIKNKIEKNLREKCYDMRGVMSKTKKANPPHINNPINSNATISLINFSEPNKGISFSSEEDEFNQWNEAIKKYPKGAKDTWSASRVVPDFRYEAACYNTGPHMYAKYLKDSDPRVFEKFRFEKGKEPLFEKVDAEGKWREKRMLKRKMDGVRSDDTEFPSFSKYILDDDEIMNRLKKLGWA